MSIKDITDYVRLTPGNTNPSVIGSMVQSEVNGTLKESKAYTDEEVGKLKKSGSVGYVEKKVLTHKYSPGGNVLIGQLPYARIADPIDPKTIVSATMMSNGEEITVTGDDIEVLSDAAEIVLLRVMGVDAGYIFYADVPMGNTVIQAGLYVLSTEYVYATRVEYETIHTIDPMFLPGAVLPVIELSTDPDDTGDGSVLSAEEAAKMDALNGMPCIMKLDFVVYKFTIVTSSYEALREDGSMDLVYVASSSLGEMNLIRRGGVWKFHLFQG